MPKLPDPHEHQRLSVAGYRMAVSAGACVAAAGVTVVFGILATAILVWLVPIIRDVVNNYSVWGAAWRLGLAFGAGKGVVYAVPLAVAHWNPSDEDLILCDHDRDDDGPRPA